MKVLAAALLVALLAATAVNGISLRHVQRKVNVPKPVYETPEIIDKESDDNFSEDGELSDEASEAGAFDDAEDSMEDAAFLEAEGDDPKYIQPEIVDKLKRGDDDGDDDGSGDDDSFIETKRGDDDGDDDEGSDDDSFIEMKRGDDDGDDDEGSDDDSFVEVEGDDTKYIQPEIIGKTKRGDDDGDDDESGDDDSFIEELLKGADEDEASLMELLDELQGDDDDDGSDDDGDSYVQPEIVDKGKLHEGMSTGFVQIQARVRGSEPKYVTPEIISLPPRFVEVHRSDDDTYVTPEIRDPAPRFRQMLTDSESGSSESDSPEEKAIEEQVREAESSGSSSQGEVAAAPLVPGSQSSSSGSGCQSGACGFTFVQPSDCGSACGGDSGSSGVSVDDAVRGVDDWIKDFKKRTGENIDLYSAADDAARPLVESLKVQQDDALAKLEDTNEEIRDHVRERVSEHMVNLLRNQNVEEEKEEEKTLDKANADAAKEAVEQAEEKAEEAESELAHAEKEVNKAKKSEKVQHEKDEESFKNAK